MVKAILKKLAKYSILAWLLISTITAIAAITPELSAGDTNNNITVNPDVIILDSLTSGSYNGQILLVANNAPVNITVAGLGETPEGGVIALSAQEDTSSCSARSWISVDKTQLLTAGIDQAVTVIINVPPGTTPGQKFASIVVENPSASFSILIPIILTIDKDSFTPNYSGQITGLNVPAVYQDKPLHIQTYFSNTGNCLITNSQINTTVKDSTGTVVWTNDALVAMPSVMPGFPRNIDTIYRAGLHAGNYSVTSTITLATGQINNMSTNFNVLEPIPPPDTPVLIGPGGPTAPGGDPITTFTPTFQWNPVSGADYYELIIKEAPFGDSDVIYDNPEITANSFTLPSGIIWGATEYSWELTATNAYGTSAPAAFYFQTYGTPIQAATLDATDVTYTGATLNGALLSLGTDSSVSVNFEYGLNTGYGSTTSSKTTNATGQVSIPVNSLTPNTTYHFRMHVLGASDAWGGDKIFQTPSALPTITNITPSAEKAGATLTVTGTNFIAGTTVTFNGVNSPMVTLVSSTALTATVPNLGTENIGSVTIVLTNSGGSATSTSFSYIGSALTPTITGISPSSAAAGATVTITGTNFISGTLVYFNGVQSPSTSINSNTQVTAQVPDLGMGNTNNVPVVVSNSAGTVTSNTFNYLGNGTTSTPTPTPTTTPSTQTTTPFTLSKPPSSRVPGQSQPGNYLLPGMDPNSLVVFSFNMDASFASAVDETGMEVYLSGFNGDGHIALAKYLAEPSGIAAFSAPESEGGTGKPAIKFMDAFVDGVKQGTAAVTVYFNPSETKGFNLNSLFLAYYYNGKWYRCEDMSLSTSNGAVTGNIPVVRLNGTIVGLGGDKTGQNSASVLPVAQNNGNNGNSSGIPWYMFAIIVVPIIIIGVIAVLIGRGRRKGTADN
ncbi:MAG: hypothetical protein ABR886_02900 [Dehalococcoidales bacterium]